MELQAVRLLLLTAGCIATGTVSAQTFTDVTSGAGVTYLQHAAQSAPDCILAGGNFCEPERMSGGAAVADVDADGDLDLLVTRIDAPDILFRNLGNGIFEDASATAGLNAFDVRSNGAAFGDVDNDGDPDLYVMTIGDYGDIAGSRNYLFINDGSGVFTEEALPRGAAVQDLLDYRHGYSAVFGDFDRDGWLDLHVTEWNPPAIPHSRLLRNLGPEAPGYFEDRTINAGLTLDEVHAFSSTFTDLDGDGWPDLAIAADFGTSKLYWNNGDGTFTDGTAAAMVGTDENGMGSTFGDIDGDGDFEWFVTSIWDENQTCETSACNWGYSGNRLYRNEGGRVFSDMTDSAGVREGYWGWGAGCLDFDNDADVDLVMTNGVDFPAGDVEDAFNTDPMRLWRNDGIGSMTEISAAAGLTDTGSGKGLLLFDYDDDGDQDLFVVNNAASGRLFRNDGGNANGWLRVRTQGTVSNRDGVGARITLEEVLGGAVQVREIGTSTHFLAQSEPVAHFGVGSGSAPLGRVTVIWPSGIVQEFLDVARNTTLLAVEPPCTDSDGDGYCSGLDCDDDEASIRPGVPDVCGNGVDDNCNLQTDELGCVTLIGVIPDGASGAPLTLSLVSNGDLLLTWTAPCVGSLVDYVVYQGTLGAFNSHLPVTCSTGSASMATFKPQPADSYYLIAGAKGGSEGSYGRGSNGLERPHSAAACFARAVAICP